LPDRTPSSKQIDTTLRTSIGDFPLNEYRLTVDGRDIRVLHADAMLSRAKEDEGLLTPEKSLPYGAMLWASSIALAHEMADGGELAGKMVLELGAGTGLPGLTAAAKGATVLQTDNHPVALELARRNASLNEISNIEQQHADWREWQSAARYDFVIGSDILYSKEMHSHIRMIFDSSLAASGRILVSDPFRATSLAFFQQMESEGWSVQITKWTIGEGSDARAIGVFRLTQSDQ
jgi:methyltransferase-like protein 23